MQHGFSVTFRAISLTVDVVNGNSRSMGFFMRYSWGSQELPWENRTFFKRNTEFVVESEMPTTRVHSEVATPDIK